MKHTVKLFLCIAVAVTSIAMFAACEDDKSSDPLALVIDQTAIDVLPAGGKTLISINTGLAWTAVADAEWVRISPASGNSSGIVNVEFDRHIGVRRAAKINFTVGAITKTVDIVQRGQTPVLDFLYGKNLTISRNGKVDSIVLTSNLNLTVTANVNWIHFDSPVTIINNNVTGTASIGITIADAGYDNCLHQADGVLEYDVTPGTYYVLGLLNYWYGAIAGHEAEIDYDVEITLE